MLAYSVIMLNTDAHNPHVSNKMTKSDFVRINAGAGGEGAQDEGPPRGMLEEIYDSIVHNEIKLKDDGGPGGRDSSRGAKQATGALTAVLNLAAPRRRGGMDTRLVRASSPRETRITLKTPLIPSAFLRPCVSRLLDYFDNK